MQKESQTYKIAPADRLASVSEYYFSKKLKEVAQMNAEGKDVISLGIGSPDMPPSRETIETLCNNAHDPNGHGYQPYVGIPELRKGFAAWYQRWYGVELNPNTEIQPLIGSKEGILHVVTEYYYRSPGQFNAAYSQTEITLNEQQQELIDEFREDFLKKLRSS